MANDKKFAASFVLGLVLLPASAIGAVVLAGDGAEATPEPTIAAAETVSWVAPAVEPFLSETDVWQACVPDAALLLEKEADETITPIEDAALDALRSICPEEGMPLDGPPAPPPITRTVIVSAPSPAPTVPIVEQPPSIEETATDTSQADSTESADEATSDDEREDEEQEAGDSDNQASAGQSQYVSAHASASAAISAAVSAGAKGEDLNEAQEQLREAEAKAANNDFWGALEKALEAEKKAREAAGERED